MHAKDNETKLHVHEEDKKNAAPPSLLKDIIVSPKPTSHVLQWLSDIAYYALLENTQQNHTRSYTSIASKTLTLANKGIYVAASTRSGLGVFVSAKILKNQIVTECGGALCFGNALKKELRSHARHIPDSGGMVRDGLPWAHLFPRFTPEEHYTQQQLQSHARTRLYPLLERCDIGETSHTTTESRSKYNVSSSSSSTNNSSSSSSSTTNNSDETKHSSIRLKNEIINMVMNTGCGYMSNTDINPRAINVRIKSVSPCRSNWLAPPLLFLVARRDIEAHEEILQAYNTYHEEVHGPPTEKRKPCRP